MAKNKLERIENNLTEIIAKHKIAQRSLEEDAAKVKRDLEETNTKASAALGKGDLEAYKKYINDAAALEAMRDNLQSRIEALKVNALMDPAESSAIKDDVVAIVKDGVDAAEKIAFDHIAALAKLAAEVSERNEKARQIITMLVKDIEREIKRPDSGTHLGATYNQIDRLIPRTDLENIALNLTDRTYHLSEIYRRYSGEEE